MCVCVCVCVCVYIYIYIYMRVYVCEGVFDDSMTCLPSSEAYFRLQFQTVNHMSTVNEMTKYHPHKHNTVIGFVWRKTVLATNAKIVAILGWPK